MGGASISKRTTRGKPQVGVLTSPLWIIVINTILSALRRKRMTIIANADDVAILTAEINPQRNRDT